MTAAVSSPKAYTHPTPLKTLAPHLVPHLPESLPLLRRLQFHTSSPSARTIATFPSSSSSPPPPTFAATWTDRTRAPETECWIFSTYETLPSPPPPSQRQKEEAKAQCRALLAAIARLPPTRTPVVVVGSLNEKLLGLIGGEEDVRRLVPRDVVSRNLEHVDDDDDDDDEGGDKGGGVRGVVNSISVPYCKWLIGPPSDRGIRDHEGEAGEGEGGGRGGGRRSRENEDDDTSGLPPGYAFGKLNASGTGHELRLTMSRSAIPRTEKTLAELGNRCVRHRIPTSTSTSPTPHPHTTPPHTNPPPPPPQHNNNNNEDDQAPPIAWAYLGVDGSLTSLHVEPLHRNLGLAKAVTRRLLRCLADDAAGMGFRDVDPVAVDGGNGNDNEGARKGEYGGGGKGWAHSDVAEGNAGSVGVARGVGGKEGWRVRWVGVDLGAVLAEEEEEEEERAVG